MIVFSSCGIIVQDKREKPITLTRIFAANGINNLLFGCRVEYCVLVKYEKDYILKHNRRARHILE